MASQSYMRVGDADREATAGELREHFASGRLTQEEFDERLNQTFAAKTRADLDAVLRDLPSARPLTATAPPRSDYGSGTWSGSGAWSGSAHGGTGGGTGRRTGILTGAMAALWSMVLVFGVLDLGFGVFGGRPLGIGLILAALAVLRRLVFRRVFSRRRGWGGPGGRSARRR
jgi:Domain of unknown function (DUF1707)